MMHFDKALLEKMICRRNSLSYSVTLKQMFVFSEATFWGSSKSKPTEETGEDRDAVLSGFPYHSLNSTPAATAAVRL